MHKLTLLGAFLFAAMPLFSQHLPELKTPVVEKNYFAICKQLDAYFATGYEPETDCWDNEWVKYQRWKWFWHDRVKPDGSFPDLDDQWLEYRKHFMAQAQSRGFQPSWKNEGPENNTGGGYWGMGRTKHVAFHPFDPFVFYVGTPDGGIWKTEDGGGSYIPLGDQLPYLPVGVILIDHQQPDTMYISLGDKIGWWQYNMGVYKSTDGGLNWAPTGLNWKLSQYKVIYAMEMSPADPAVLFVASNGGILRSKDGGETWGTVKSGEFTDIKFRPNDPNTLYAAQYDYWGVSQIHKSVDGGDNWSQISNFQDNYNEIRLAVTLANPDYLGVRCSAGKKFYRSTDAGASLEFRSQMPEDFQFYFSQTDTNTVYCANTVLHRSTDGGNSWVQITNWWDDGYYKEIHADFHHITHDPHNPSVLYFCNDGGVYYYDEPSEEWIDFSNGLAIAQFYSIALSEAGPLRLAAGSQDNGGWLRKPNYAWVHTNGGDAMTQAIDPTNGDILYTEYYGGNDIYRVTNNGSDFVTISDNLPDNPSGAWVTPFVLNPKNPKSMIIGFHDVYRSFDRGDSFHKISQNLTGKEDNKIRDIVYAPSDTNIIFAAFENKIYRTGDSGQNWTSYVVTGSEDITRIAVHPNDAQRMWVTRGGYSAGNKVFQSKSSGVSWKNISANLPNVPVNCILYDPQTNYLLLGTDIGVFYSDADVVNWKPYATGMPNVYVLDLKLRQASHTLYAGTHGRGVYSIPLEVLVDAGEQAGASSAVRVFPNPASTSLYFDDPAREPVTGVLQLFDRTGRLVVSRRLDAVLLSQTALQVGHLAEGLYCLRLTDQAGREVLAEKVVVERF